MEEETRTLAQQLLDYGFPAITRWEVENNCRRQISADGRPCLPPLGALISELPKRIVEIKDYVVKDGYGNEVKWDECSYLTMSAYENKKGEQTWEVEYSDGDYEARAYCNVSNSKLEEALALMYIHLKLKAKI